MNLIDFQRPRQLYRYSEKKWLEKSLSHGEFRLRPASDYKFLEADRARQDDELKRVRHANPESLIITVADSNEVIKPIGPVTFTKELKTNYLTLCLSLAWEERLFAEFSGSDSCLVIHEPESFCERIHAAASEIMPDWHGIDGRVAYGEESLLGSAFSKPVHFSKQHEWRFAWVPPLPKNIIQAQLLRIGSIKDIAEIMTCPITSSE
jgi:hypothetical protein